MHKDLIFYQMFEPETSTYTYLLGDKVSKEAIIIDPVLETVDRDMNLINELDLKLRYVLDTHVHADHITGAGELRSHLHAKTCMSKESEVGCADILLEDGQELMFGQFSVKALSTPGHTNTCMTFSTEGMLFTGDNLLIRGCGRTDFQMGNSEQMYESVHNKVFSFPDETIVYPGHDYRGQTKSTVGLEKKFNPRLGKNVTLESFKTIMKELNLAAPKKIHEAVPANLVCGIASDDNFFHAEEVNGIPEIHPNHLKDVLGKVKVIDVRGADEYIGEYGHIPGAVLATLDTDLHGTLESLDPKEPIAFVCRSGGRSGQATSLAKQLGFENVVNMQGGMMLWTELCFDVTR